MALIYSRNPDNTVLTLDEIRTRAPAVFAETKAEHLTDRYAQLRTADFIPVMQDYGYEVTQAAQSRKKSKSGLEHKHHFLAFTNTKDEGVDGVRPEVILYNSHDGSGAVKLMSGAFRFICSNGIIRGEGTQSRMYHNANSMNKFETILGNTIENLPTVMHRIAEMQAITLEDTQVKTLARKAFLTRWNEEQLDEAFSIPSMTSVRRLEDNLQDAWTVFNRIQENVLRGGVMIKRIAPTGEEKIRKACAIANPKEHIRINAELWDVAQEVITELAV